jgi:DNA-binding NtrC family response regulator
MNTDLPPDLQTAVDRLGAAAAELHAAERALTLAALKAAGNNRTRAARLLGIPDRTMFRRVAALGLDAPPAPPNVPPQLRI